jgi:hypothetical protein
MVVRSALQDEGSGRRAEGALSSPPSTRTSYTLHLDQVIVSVTSLVFFPFTVSLTPAKNQSWCALSSDWQD